MAYENNLLTIHIIVRNESFELTSSLFQQLIEYSSSNDFISFLSDNQQKIFLNIHPNIFNAYLLYIQSGCFIRPENISEEDLINDLRICGAPITLINHYEYCDITSTFSHTINDNKKIEQKWLNTFILIGLFIGTYILTIDLYRQILILNKNPYKETSLLLIISIYLIDSILFIYSCIHGIIKIISNFNKKNQLEPDSDIIIDIISCLGILCYFTIQRPITNVYLSYWNSLWIFIHICRTIRIAQIGFRLIDIQLCLYAIIQCFSTFIKTFIGLFWIFIISGSILYIIDIIENNQQYSNIYVTILSSHETLYTIGYRNNAPYGYFTRLWTIISIYFFSSFIQIFLWWFQTRVMIQWKKFLDK